MIQTEERKREVKAFKQKIGLELAKIRINETDYTQAKASDLINASDNYVRMLENGKINPTFMMICKLCKVYNISISDLTERVAKNDRRTD